MKNEFGRYKIILYADDTLIYAEGETDDQYKQYLLHNINNINYWLKMNKLKLNESKTVLLQISMNDDSVIKINNERIEKVVRIKYVGFIIDKDLKLNKHIDNICKKIGFLKRIRNKISMTAINIYNTVIKPYFEFGSSILYTCRSTTQIERLQKLQNKVVRSILKYNKYTPIQIMFDTLKWLDIQ